ncbi:hypothetical protein BABINDRAFT_160536 [Babjeviella inositovora NRRL Y-12698]|uniref:Nudix hydrolase domain-containing protein n=1 Tax=Babjeviella inositovora NRRL Y-12698 TaxID=984486 RepID=A0A1E3QUA1_9ASCO|nr:uncharacterized protein BABINDRAFT_160536 [Babjeviella inositovora NRRL Y-12698]ODQ81134.1 hypothetical protein BABINDRAFT_160536 [Babjeviella inositovora NRRL Y-12698]
MTVQNAATYLAKIRAYAPRHFQNGPKTVWHHLPVNRRSAVLLLLFLGSQGELRVLLTKRSSKLKSFPGQISLPGGKADTGLETAWDVALRETEEEIGIARDAQRLMDAYGCLIERLGELPCYMSRNLLAVRPCVGFLSWQARDGETSERVAEELALSLNPGESSSIFSVPVRDIYLSYLAEQAPEKPLECLGSSRSVYKWAGIPWCLKSFLFPIESAHEPKWLNNVTDLPSDEEALSDDEKRAISYGRTGYRRSSITGDMIKDVWGLTANILHDLAEIMYASLVDTEIGEEELIYALRNSGQSMGNAKGRTPWEKKLIEGDENVSFKDVLPAEEFERLKRMYASAKL